VGIVSTVIDEQPEPSKQPGAITLAIAPPGFWTTTLAVVQNPPATAGNRRYLGGGTAVRLR